MGTIPKMYEQIKLKDGRAGIVVDFLGDVFIVDTQDDNKQWITVEVVMVGEEFHVCDNEGEIYTLCRRKGIRLQVSEDAIYTFMLGDSFEGEYFCFNSEQFQWLCGLLRVDAVKYVDAWSEYFEYNGLTEFLNAHKIITSDEFYYAYGYDAEEKTADALYRFHKGSFERYFPKDGVWREIPEQRMVLADKKPRYTRLSESEGSSLALLA
ncbi:MAG: hypothetical protein E7260_12190 [Lachnospiraceae bacterium]|nr:hypothetical protein [Lachnospiraceae bacterium]